MKIARLVCWPIVATVLVVVFAASYLEIVTRPAADPSDDSDTDGRPARPGGDAFDGAGCTASSSAAAPVSASHTTAGVPSGSRRDGAA